MNHQKNEFPSKSTTIKNIAANFWSAADIIPIYPVEISLFESAICLSKNLNIIKISKLSINEINNWFQKRRYDIGLEKSNNLLFGFLHAYKGVGFIFLNGSESISEQRYTLAHELAHFILDYEIPRAKAIRRFGESILEVLDGLREPTLHERLDGMLNNISINPVNHLLDTPSTNSLSRLNVWKIEGRTDQLSLELLAPKHVIAKKIRKEKLKMNFDLLLEYFNHVLIEDFCLPISIVPSYSRHLAYFFSGGKSLSDQWGIKI